MSFIVQGKTNWKFLLIVIILAVIVGGGALWCYLRFQEIKFPSIQPEKKVTITTDKIEYEQGELIKITVRNGLDIPILYYDSERFWGIEYLEDEEWKNPEYERGGGFQLTEENINDICYIRLYEIMPPVEMKSYSTLSQQWNQKICPFGEEDPSESRFVKYIGTGRYRLIFYYGFEISDEDPYKISNQKTIYSNEFTIKEKDETADWKTYKNEEYGFEIKYPSTLNYKEKQGGLFGIEFPKLQLGLIIERKPENFINLESYLNTVAKEKNNDCKIEEGDYKRYCYSVESKDFGDNKTFALIYHPLGGNSGAMGCTGIDVYCENGDYLSVASYGYCSVDFDESFSGPGAKVYLENFNTIQQMLSTFRFLK